MNWLQYIYTRQRKYFGRQCLFTDRNELLFDLPSNYDLIGDYILRNPVDRDSQLSTQMALSLCNTESATFANRGMNHSEGGWPKDVNFLDEEQTLRYRKKIEREEIWGKQVLGLTKPAIEAVLQNSAVNIYQEYFADMPDVNLVDDYVGHETNVFRDRFEDGRVIRNLSFNPTQNNLFLGTYGALDHYPDPESPKSCYIWDIENSNAPLATLEPPSMATILEWCPKDSSFIAGGLSNGIVAVWDFRAGETPTAVSPLETTHREGVTAICFVHSKTNTEFYSGSGGGAINYWDARNLEEPVNTFLLDPEKTDEQSRSRAHGCTVLEFEYTIPIRYMAGTDQGSIFLGNRKGVTATEALVGNFRVMSGPVKSLERNPVFVKNFLVIGDWCAKIWTEECKDNPLIRTRNHKTELNCGTWSKGRCSLFFTGQEDGTVHFWDLIMDQKEPIYSMKMFKAPITALRSSNTGGFLGVGTEAGNIHIVKLNEVLTHSLPKEKPFISAMFERETRRVKLLEARIREIKLKMAEEKKKEPEITEEEEEGIGEEERSEIAIEPVPEIAIPVDEEGEEEGEEEEGDIELMAVRSKFFEIITDEEEKRKDRRKYTLLNRTAFDPNFGPSDIDDSKYKATSSPKIDDEAKRLAEIRAIIEQKKEEGTSIDVKGAADKRNYLPEASRKLSIEEPVIEEETEKKTESESKGSVE